MNALGLLINILKCFRFCLRIRQDIWLFLTFRVSKYSEWNYFLHCFTGTLLQKQYVVESLQSHFILTMSHWSSGLHSCFPSQGTWVLTHMWNRGSPVSVVLLHWWPRNDSDHWIRHPSVGASLGSAPTMCKPAASSLFSGCFTRLRADNVYAAIDLITQLFFPGFTLAAGPLSGFATDGVGCRGGALWRACNLTSFSPCLTGPVDYLVASRHKGPGFKSPGRYLCETRILLLALSRYRVLYVQYVLAKNYNPLKIEIKIPHILVTQKALLSFLVWPI